MNPLRRSFVHHRISAPNPRAGAVDGSPPTSEPSRADRLSIADLSIVPRCGFKGPGAVAWLKDAGLSLPADPNQSQIQPDGSEIAMLSWSEALLLGHPDTRASHRLMAEWSLDSTTGVYAVPRADTHYWFRVTGSDAAAMFSKICPIDLDPGQFPQGKVAQTSAARSNLIIIRSDLGRVLSFHVLGDSGSAEYVFDCLIDAMQEFGGGLAAP